MPCTGRPGSHSDLLGFHGSFKQRYEQLKGVALGPSTMDKDGFGVSRPGLGGNLGCCLGSRV